MIETKKRFALEATQTVKSKVCQEVTGMEAVKSMISLKQPKGHWYSLSGYLSNCIWFAITIPI